MPLVDTSILITNSSMPVSGSLTANAGTNLNTSLLALETGGNLATINTNSAPLLVGSAGGYIRQDSTATIAKESGGNLATLAGAVTSSVVQSNTKQINGVAPSMGNGVTGTGVQRVTLSSDSTGQVALVSGTTVGVGLYPSGTALNTYSIHLTTNATTTPTTSTAYISSIAISNEVGGTTSSISIQDKQGTPLKLVNGLATTALTTAPTIISFNTPVKMVSGIDIITSGAVAATVDVWVNYYQ